MEGQIRQGKETGVAMAEDMGLICGMPATTVSSPWHNRSSHYHLFPSWNVYPATGVG